MTKATKKLYRKRSNRRFVHKSLKTVQNLRKQGFGSLEETVKMIRIALMM